MTEAGIDAGLFRHYYIAMGEPLKASWGVHAYYKPMVEFIWLGAFVIALGGALAAVGRRLLAVSPNANMAVLDPNLSAR